MKGNMQKLALLIAAVVMVVFVVVVQRQTTSAKEEPKVDHDVLSQEHTGLSQEHSTLENAVTAAPTHSDLSQDHTTLQNAINALVSAPTRSDLSQQLADLQAAVDALASPFMLFPGDGVDGPALAYQDNPDGTITDLNTGLMWEKKVAGSGCLHCVGDTYTWAYATTTWINDVNNAGFAGFNDWRLANVMELHSIVDYGRVNPSIDPAFGPTTASNYWSSTAAVINPAAAWSVAFNFGGGGVSGTLQSGTRGVRAVRGGR